MRFNYDHIARMNCSTFGNFRIKQFSEQVLNFMEGSYTCACHHKDIGKALSDYGGAVSGDGIVRFTRHLLKKAIDVVPKEVRLRTRASTGQEIVISPFSETPIFAEGIASEYCNLDGNTFRKPSLEDVASVAKLIDALPHLNLIVSRYSQNASSWNRIDELLAVFSNTEKPFIQKISSLEDIEQVKRLLPQLKDRFPGSYGILIEADGESCFDEIALQALVAAASHEVPIIYFVTLPATVVTGKDALLKCGAHLLAVLCLSQAIRSSTPIVLGVKGGKKGTAPEFLVQVSALNAMMKEFGIPFGLDILSDAAQEGNLWALEMSFFLGIASLIGAPMISGLTSFRGGSATSAVMFPIVNEVYDFVNRSFQAHQFDQKTFALDTIHETIARGSSEFLSSRHTVEFFRSIMWKTELMDKRGYERWEAAGRPNLKANAHQKAQQILSSVADKQLPREFIDAVKSLK